MSFKTMDGVEVYDKHDVDLIKDSIDATTSQHTSDITQLKTKANSLENSKASTASVQDLNNRTTAVEQRLTGDENNISEHNNRITTLENNSATVEQMNQGLNAKANQSYAEQTRQIANSNRSDITALETRATALEQNKLNVSDLPQAVDNAVNDIINSKLSLIESDINHIVGNAIDAELNDYNDSDTVDQKIATAIDNELDGYDDKAAVNQKISTAVEAAVATRPVAMSTAEATALVNQYF